MKKTLLIALTSLTIPSLIAKIDVEGWPKASKRISSADTVALPWAIEFKNKDSRAGHLRIFKANNEPILIREDDLHIYIDPSKGSKESQHGYFRLGETKKKNYTKQDLELSPEDGYIIWISKNRESNMKTKTRTASPDLKYQILPNAKRKAIFLTWENNELKPQKGTGVFSKEAQSGPSLSDNVKQKEIIKLK